MSPAPGGFGGQAVAPAAAHWHSGLGEYLLDWDDVIAAADPQAAGLDFARSVFRHACAVCEWDPGLAGSADGTPPPLR